MNPRVPRSRVSQDRWLVSYADFITLLFGFFVVLYAFAKADQKKQAQVSQAIGSAFTALGAFPSTASNSSNAAKGASQSKATADAVMGETVVSAVQVKGHLENLRRDLMQTLSTQVAAGSVSIQMNRDGLVISLREAGFFDSGSAEPKPSALPTLRQIAGKLSATPYDLRVEGHTDNVPIHNAAFDSNWELSSARATRIARIFLDMRAIPPDRLSAAGYAEYHPVASNDTVEGRAENRRVDLVVMPRTEINFAAPDAATQPGLWRRITDEN